MPDSMGMEWRGGDALLADLRELHPAIQARVMKGMVATGASVIRREAIQRAPEYTGKVSEGHPPPGTLKRAIYQVRLPEASTATLEAWKIGVRSGKRSRSVGKRGVNLDAYYATWVEYGHYARAPGKLTRSAKAARVASGEAKWIAAKPFLRPAVAVRRDDAFRAMQNYLQSNLPLAAAAMRILEMRS